MQRAEAWRAEANVRRRGVGRPERRGGPRSPSLTRLGFLGADPSGAAVREPYRFRDWAFWRRADHISQAIGSTDTSTMPTTTSSKFSFTIGKLPKK